MRDFTIAPLAADDLDGIWLYFAQFDPINADIFVAEILDTLDCWYEILWQADFATR